MLNRSGPSIDPCGTPDLILSYELKTLLMLVLWYRFFRLLCINLSELLENPYAFSFASKRL